MLDTLRADALGCYGYARDTSPAIDAFASQGVRVERALSPASYTLASTASLLTGLGPAAHRVLGLSTNVLPDSALTLAERLSAAGFATLALSCNPHVVAPGGFDQGFDQFRFHVRDRFDAHTVPEAVLSELVEWWTSVEGQRRFAYVHLLPPHSPYDPPAPFAEAFGAAATERSEGFTESVVSAKERADWSPDDPFVQRMRSRYDAGLAYVDDWFDCMLAELEQELGDTVVVLLSDHGEGFGEHGQVSHGSNVWPESVHVPLLVRAPGLAPRVAASSVGTADTGATLLDLLGLESQGFGGASFLNQLTGGAGDGRPMVSRSEGQFPLWALRRKGWTLVRHDRSDRSLLFRTSVDEGERRELSLAEPAQLSAMETDLAEFLEQGRGRQLQGTGPRNHDAHSQMLIELGYVEEESR